MKREAQQLAGTGLHWRHVSAVVLFLTCLYGTHAAGQVSSGDTLPDALKHVNPAGSSCRRADVIAAGSSQSQVAEVPPDPSCAITVTETKTLLGRPNVIPVDVRPESDYQAFHIQGAVNGSLSGIRSKPYWRGKTVLLVGHGKAERDLYVQCRRLKQDGFQDVRVLRGGMAAWLATDQGVTGRPPGTAHLARLSASEFWAESRSPDNLVVLGAAQQGWQSDLPTSMVLPQVNREAMKALLATRGAQSKMPAPASLLLVLPVGVTDQEIKLLQIAAQPIAVLVYADTREELVRQIVIQKAVWAAHARGPKQPACGQ